MTERIKVTRVWSHKHPRHVDSMSMAGVSGDALVLDRRDTITLIGANGEIVWDKKVGFSPLAGQLTEDGSAAYILSCDGRIYKVNRAAELEWEAWVDRSPLALSIKSGGEAAVVVCQRGRLHIMNSLGKRIRLLHTPVPVAHARVSASSGTLYVASVHGWLGRYDRRFNPMGEISLGVEIAEVAVSERGKKIFLPARGGGLNVIDLSDSHMTTYNPGFAVIKVGIDEKGNRVAAVSLDGDIALMNEKGGVMWSQKSEHSWTMCEMNRKGDRFVTVSGKGEVFCYAVGDAAGVKGKEEGKDYFDFLEV